MTNFVEPRDFDGVLLLDGPLNSEQVSIYTVISLGMDYLLLILLCITHNVIVPKGDDPARAPTGSIRCSPLPLTADGYASWP